MNVRDGEREAPLASPVDGSAAARLDRVAQDAERGQRF